MSDELTEDEWHAWRRTGITATEVADAANDTYGGAYGVVARKLELEPRAEPTDVMTRGHRWQAAIAGAVYELTGYHVLDDEACVTCETDPRWLATVDAFLAQLSDAQPDEYVAPLEVKTRGVRVWPNRARWRDQVQWQLMVTGRPFAIIAEATIDDDTDTCTGVALEVVEADPYRQAELLEVAEVLWAHYTAGTLPPPTSSSLELVKRLTRDVDDTHGPVDLTELDWQLERLVELDEALERATAERAELEAVLRDAVADATEGRGSRWSVRITAGQRKVPADVAAELVQDYPEHTKRVLDLDALKKHEPDVYEASRQPAGGRRLTYRSLDE